MDVFSAGEMPHPRGLRQDDRLLGAAQRARGGRGLRSQPAASSSRSSATSSAPATCSSRRARGTSPRWAPPSSRPCASGRAVAPRERLQRVHDPLGRHRRRRPARRAPLAPDHLPHRRAGGPVRRRPQLRRARAHGGGPQGRARRLGDHRQGLQPARGRPRLRRLRHHARRRVRPRLHRRGRRRHRRRGRRALQGGQRGPQGGPLGPRVLRGHPPARWAGRSPWTPERGTRWIGRRVRDLVVLRPGGGPAPLRGVRHRVGLPLDLDPHLGDHPRGHARARAGLARRDHRGHGGAPAPPPGGPAARRAELRVGLPQPARTLRRHPHRVVRAQGGHVRRRADLARARQLHRQPRRRHGGRRRDAYRPARTTRSSPATGWTSPARSSSSALGRRAKRWRETRACGRRRARSPR